MAAAAAAGLFEVLRDADLQRYHDAFRNELGVRTAAEVRAATDDSLARLGLSRAERRRLRKACDRRSGDTCLSRIRRLLRSPDAHSETAAGRPSKHVIPCENIAVNKELGTGEFGVVQQGVWTNEGRSVQVAIKCLYRDQMHANAIEFLKEAAIMHDIDHENVVRLYGVVLHPQSLMLVTELAPLRSLLECLRESSLRSTFSVPTLCEFALQICEGMAHLESKRLIHRDLAARNVLVFAKNKVKISDFGLSRALGAGEDYYRTNFNVNLKLPIAWCAPECISYLRFTSASDVWAFGVTLWEMFSYGFQPWAAFNGREILAAVDEPNRQRLERPECCPAEYYSTMLECWAHEPADRPKFSELVSVLPERRPERVRAVSSSKRDASPEKTETLNYKAGDVITVLDKNGHGSRWKGILNSGVAGYFNPLNTVSYLGSNLPNSGVKSPFLRAPEGIRNSLIRTDRERLSASRRKLRGDMISAPQGEVKHTGHVGLDGAYFGDVSFLEYNSLPKQIVAPYKPSDDLEQVPLINPNSPSHLTADSTMILREPIEQTESIIPTGKVIDRSEVDGCVDNASGVSVQNEGMKRDALSSGTVFSFDSLSIQKRMSKFKWPKKKDNKARTIDEFLSDPKSSMQSHNSNKVCENKENSETDILSHDYQEISDEDEQKASDFGQSLLDEMELMFQSYGESSKLNVFNNQDFINTNHKNELTELNSKLSNGTSTSKKKQTVKPISAHDQRTLDSAIALANKITVKSMTDLDKEEHPNTPTSPVEKSKFSFLFPLIGNGHSQSSVNSGITKGSDGTHGKIERRNFSQEAQSVPDIQNILTEESKLAYESLVEQPCRLETTLLKIKQKQATPLHLNGSSTLGKPEGSNLKSKNGFSDKLDSCFDAQSSKFQNDIPKDIFKIDKGKSELSSTCEARINSIDSPDGIDLTTKDITNANPIPLPPKDPRKHLDTGKRHVRKHPLVIQAAENTNGTQINSNNILESNDIFYSKSINIADSQNKCLTPQKSVTHINEKFNNLDIKSDIVSIPTLNPFDTPSLNFECQIENNLDSIDCCDGMVHDFDFEPPSFNKDGKVSNNIFGARPTFHTFNIPQQSSTNCSNYENQTLSFIDDDNLLHLNPNDRYSEYSMGNSTFMKHSPDRVSVEDLLEFADQKPCGRQRGTDSDEVRIMCKVLNQQVNPEACLLALEFASWNVHRAIKLAKLKFMGLDSPTLYDCSVALDSCEWDVARAAAMLADNADVAQV